MKPILALIIFFIFFSLQIISQPIIYGLAKKPGSQKEIYLAKVDPDSGLVTIISPQSISSHLVCAGASLDYYHGLYFYFAPGATGIEIEAVDINTGILSYHVPLNFPSGYYLHSPQFNCNDSGIYAIKRNSQTSQLEFGKLNNHTALFYPPSISFTGGVSDNYTFDKKGNTYFFTDNNLLTGINLPALVSSSMTFPIPSGDYFENIEFNCKDSCIYGSYRNASGVKFAKLDLSTGTITVLSGSAFTSSGMLGSGHALDDVHGIYYYNTGTEIFTIRISDGALLNSRIYAYSQPGTYNLFYIKAVEICECQSSITSNITDASKNDFILYPNPFNNHFIVETGNNQLTTFKLFDVTSKLIWEEKFINSKTLNAGQLPDGVYLYSISDDFHIKTGKILKQ